MVKFATLRLAFVLSRASIWLHGLAHSFDIYTTRTAEALVAWFTLAWSIAVLGGGDMLTGPQYKPMLRLMTEDMWGVTVTSFALLRILALIGNGHWRPSPHLRFISATYSLVFWIVLEHCYWRALQDGANDFPMRYSIYVLILFEVYAILWIGRDMKIHSLKFMAQRADASELTGRVGNG